MGPEDEDEETVPEKRLRLAKEYLTRLEEEGIEDVVPQYKSTNEFLYLDVVCSSEEQSQKDLSDLDHDAIAHRLRQDVVRSLKDW